MLKQDGAEGGPPQRRITNNLRKFSNTSSIMLCNAPSIIQREGLPHYGWLTANIKRFPTRFCHDPRNDRAK